jgi:hypothetical protein
MPLSAYAIPLPDSDCEAVLQKHKEIFLAYAQRRMLKRRILSRTKSKAEGGYFAFEVAIEPACFLLLRWDTGGWREWGLERHEQSFCVSRESL